MIWQLCRTLSIMHAPGRCSAQYKEAHIAQHLQVLRKVKTLRERPHAVWWPAVLSEHGTRL